MDEFWGSVVGNVTAGLIVAAVIGTVSFLPKVRAWLKEQPRAVAGLIGGVAGLMAGIIGSNLSGGSSDIEAKLAVVAKEASEAKTIAKKAQNKADSTDETLPGLTSRIEEVENLKIPDLAPLSVRVGDLEDSRTTAASSLKGAVIAFDQSSGCPSGWTDVGKTDSARFAGRVLVAAGNHEGREARSYGQVEGEEKHQLTITEMPAHSHSLNHGTKYNSDLPNSGYSVSAYGTMAVDSVAGTAVGTGHNNMPPFIVLHFCEYLGPQ